MRKAYILKEGAYITESDAPDTVYLQVGNCRVSLTQDEFADLCGLRYSLHFASKLEFPPTVKYGEPNIPNIPKPEGGEF